MGIENIKYCRKCKRAYDTMKCPYCNPEYKVKKKGENGEKRVK